MQFKIIKCIVDSNHNGKVLFEMSNAEEINRMKDSVMRDILTGKIRMGIGNLKRTSDILDQNILQSLLRKLLA